MEKYYKGHLVLTDRFVSEYLEKQHPLKVIDYTPIIFRVEEGMFFNPTLEIRTGVKIPIIDLRLVDQEKKVIRSQNRLQSIIDLYSASLLKNKIRCFTFEDDRFLDFIEDSPEEYRETTEISDIINYLKQYPNKKQRKEELKTLLQNNRLNFFKDETSRLTNYEIKQAKIKEYLKKYK